MLAKFQEFWYESKEDFFKSFLDIWGFLHVKIFFISILFFNLINWLFARFIHKEIGFERIALHYSVDFGIDLYDSVENIYIVPALGTIIVFLNFLLLVLIYKYIKTDMKFISYILLTSSLVSNIVLLGAISSIYLINFR